MNSLRFRLILGFSFIAIVPLAVAIYFLSQRVEKTVAELAAERLAAALGTLQSQLRFDGERVAGKLQILGKDPLLKRLYLLRPPGSAGTRDLSDYLAEKRFLLGLDFLQVVDTGGLVTSDGSLSSATLEKTYRDSLHARARAGITSSGLVIDTVDTISVLTLTATAPVRYENRSVGVVRGGLVFDAASLARLKQTSGVDLLLRDSSGRTIAATIFPAAEAVSPGFEGGGRVTLAGRSYLAQTIPLETSGPPLAVITGLVSTGPADQTIASLQVTSTLLGLFGLGIAIFLGIVWSRQISGPVERIAQFSQKIAQGQWDEPLTLESVRELEMLVAALNRMRDDLRTYRDKLVTSERQAAWSVMARKVAHEVKNPLTPIAISIADLQRSFEQKRPDFPQILAQSAKTVTEEIETLKRLLQEFSDFAKFPPPRFAPCLLSELFTDVKTLYARDVDEGRLTFTEEVREITLSADAGQIKQALINLIKNGLEAVDGQGQVRVAVNVTDSALEIDVADNGPGLTAEQKANLFTPYFTTKAQGSGLGLTIVQRIASDHGGQITVDSLPGRGTTFRLLLPLELKR